MNAKQLKELNDELTNGLSDLPDIPPAKVLWEPPEKVPARILKKFPKEESIDGFLKLVLNNEIPNTPEVRDQIRGFVNHRRERIYWEWKKGKDS